MLRKIVFVLFIMTCQAYAQEEGPIKIVEEKIPNRLALYAVNESETDYDVMMTVTGTNFKQRAGKPRLVRVPSATKVLMQTLIVERKKQALYKYELVINDSLSRRALRKAATPIKIKPRKQITLYITEGCKTCDTIVNSLEQSKYIYTSHVLSEKPEIRKQISMALANTRTPLDSVSNPVISLAGKLYTEIEDYDTLLEKIRGDDDEK